MTHSSERQRQCADFQEALALLALGTLTGTERTETLTHVETCSDCSAELDSLAIVADSLLELVPDVEPPLGFELTLAKRFGIHEATARPPRRRRRGIYLGAAALAVSIAFDLVQTATHPPHPSSTASPAHLVSAHLSLHGLEAGQVLITAGRPSWLFLALDDGPRTDQVTCAVILSNGTTHNVGRFELHPGYRAWGAPLPVAAEQLRGVTVVTASGTILATATLPA